MYQLLVVDDDQKMLEAFLDSFRKEKDIRVVSALTGRDAVQKVKTVRPDAVVLNVMLSDMSGLETFEQIKKIDSRLPVVLVTGGSSSNTAITAVQRGALDYLSKPLDFSEVHWLIERAFAIRRLMVETVDVREDSATDAYDGDVIVGACPAMQKAYRSIGRVAAKNLTVLIRGESGTGKELVARALYQHSKRNKGPFLAVNCAAIPESLLES